MKTGSTHRGGGLPAGTWTIWAPAPSSTSYWLLPTDATAEATGIKFILARWNKKNALWDVKENRKA